MLKDILALVGLIVLLEGCGVLPATREPQPADRVSISTSILDSTHSLTSMPEVVKYISHLTHTDPSARGKLFEVSARAFQANPSESNMVRLGIILSSPHFLAHDVDNNRALLSELLDAEPSLPNNLIAVVKLRLYDLEQHVRVMRENMALRKEVDKLKLSMDKNIGRNKGKIRDLEAALGSAQAKLRALTSIEESITRNGDGPRDARE